MDAVAHLHVPQTEHDDPEFIALVSRILNAAAARYQPEDIYVVQVDKWFGGNWKRWPAGIGSMVRVRWYDSLIVPTFNPNRIRNQARFRRVAQDPVQYGEEPAAAIHLAYHPGWAKWRPLWRLADSGVFLWYSSSTNSLDRASLMLYRTEKNRRAVRKMRPPGTEANLIRHYFRRFPDELAWYVSFLKHDGWKIESANGISPRKVLRFAHQG